MLELSEPQLQQTQPDNEIKMYEQHARELVTWSFQEHIHGGCRPALDFCHISSKSGHIIINNL